MQTLKKHSIASTLVMATLDELKNNNIIVFTPAGIFSGKPITDDTDISDSNNIGYNIISKCLEEETTRFMKENSLESADGNDGYFFLKDVQLISNNIRTNIPYVVLYYDQVIGITIGKI